MPAMPAMPDMPHSTVPVASAQPVNVGVIGLGFMGRTHIGAYRSVRQSGLDCRLAAVADADPVRLSGRPAAAGNLTTSAEQALLFDPTVVRTYSRAVDLLADPGVDLVSVCTHTDTHVDLALAALQAGKHVLVEKPVAIRAGDVARLAQAARAAGRLCMPGMCMRFWPGWVWLRECIRDGRYGPVRSAVFQRLGSPPDWTPFYADLARSGGPLFDLHIHDADFIRWSLGEPAEVVSTGSPHHLTTLYRFPGGPAHVIAEGGQDHTPGFGFKMRYVVVFERATADFDFGRSPRLLLCQAGASEEIPLPAHSAYDQQAQHLVSAIAAGRAELDATIDDAVKTTALLEAELRSLQTGAPVRLA